MNATRIPEVGILGAGRLAEVGASLLSATGAKVRLWARRKVALDQIQERLPKIELSSDISKVVGPADLVLFAVPVSAMESVANQFGDHARGDQVALHATRGVGKGFRLPSELIRSKSCVKKIAAMGGPLHSRDLKSGRALAVVLASRFEESISLVKGIVKGTPLRIHSSSDINGVQIAGAISNMSALAAGMADALDLGDTARGVLLAHGLSEAQRIGVTLGADPLTFAGLAGVGDLIPRSVSSTDRHHETGAKLAKGTPLSTALEEVGGEVEGVITSQEAFALGEERGLDLPLTRAVTRILRGETEAASALEDVLRLDMGELIRPGRGATA